MNRTALFVQIERAFYVKIPVPREPIADMAEDTGKFFSLRPQQRFFRCAPGAAGACQHIEPVARTEFAHLPVIGTHGSRFRVADKNDLTLTDSVVDDRLFLERGHWPCPGGAVIANAEDVVLAL